MVSRKNKYIVLTTIINAFVGGFFFTLAEIIFFMFPISLLGVYLTIALSTLGAQTGTIMLIYYFREVEEDIKEAKKIKQKGFKINF